MVTETELCVCVVALHPLQDCAEFLMCEDFFGALCVLPSWSVCAEQNRGNTWGRLSALWPEIGRTNTYSSDKGLFSIEPQTVHHANFYD